MQVFVRVLSGGSVAVDVSREDKARDLKRKIARKAGIGPDGWERFEVSSSLVFRGRQVRDGDGLASRGCRHGDTLQLVGRLRGGKGGFGAMLRGSGRGAKETTNFDACRDLNGRRLHVAEAEKKLASWKAEKEERELARVAEKHIRDMAKEKERAQKDMVDLHKFREDLEASSGRVASAVKSGLRSSILAGSKRKEYSPAGPSSSKKCRAWGMLEDDDSDSDDSDDAEEEPVPITQTPSLQRNGNGHRGGADHEPETNGDRGSNCGRVSGELPGAKSVQVVAEGESNGEDVFTALESCTSSKDLETFGLDVLKDALKSKGLKCGGTLAQRAARLFLVKEVGIDKLDKKHFAK